MAVTRLPRKLMTFTIHPLTAVCQPSVTTSFDIYMGMPWEHRLHQAFVKWRVSAHSQYSCSRLPYQIFLHLNTLNTHTLPKPLWMSIKIRERLTVFIKPVSCIIYISSLTYATVLPTPRHPTPPTPPTPTASVSLPRPGWFRARKNLVLEKSSFQNQLISEAINKISENWCLKCDIVVNADLSRLYTFLPKLWHCRAMLAGSTWVIPSRCTLWTSWESSQTLQQSK